ncbi:MAG: hypothetical protein JW952_01940 [Candidatus Eisenbacteria bacterium]|nr:hypothetical protein [Candidatus Eisenbacteria bacterium]
MNLSRTTSPSGPGRALWCARTGVVAAWFVLAFLAAAAEADVELWPSGGSGLGSFLPTSGRASLLDPSKLGISHQMVFSYSSGSAGRDNVGGLWLTNFSYKLSTPLTVDLSVGASLSKTSGREPDAQSLFLNGFSLRYRPNENLYLHFMYNGVPNNWFLSPERLAR